RRTGNERNGRHRIEIDGPLASGAQRRRVVTRAVLGHSEGVGEEDHVEQSALEGSAEILVEAAAQPLGAAQWVAPVFGVLTRRWVHHADEVHARSLPLSHEWARGC